MDSISASIIPHSFQRSESIGNFDYGPQEKRESSKAMTRNGHYPDKVSLSPDSKDLSKRDETSAAEKTKNNNPESPSTDKTYSPDEAELDAAELREVQSLKARDAEVKAHEQAHLSTAGQYAAGGASFTYKEGPNGKRYAVGGEVPIDISRETTPEETILKMQVVRRAALAPANPSSADRKIAARASMTEAQARREQQNEVANTTEEKSLGSTVSANRNSQLQPDDTPPSPSPPSSNNTPISNNTRHMILKMYQSQ